MTTELTVIERASVALGASEIVKRLTELVKKSSAITAITNPDGRQECHTALMVYVEERVGVEKLGKAAREDATKFSKAVIETEKSIVGIISGEEARLRKIRDDYDNIEKEKAQASVRAEQARIEAEQRAIKEAEEKRMADERAAIAKAQAELAAAQKAAADKIEADARAARLKIEQDERAARMEREEADRKARQAREAEEAAAKAKRDAEEAALKKERDRLETEARAIAETKRKEQEAADLKARQERDAAEAKAKKEREAEEAKQREIQRQKTELMDGRALLTTFVTRYGHRAEFDSITGIIESFLSQKKAA